jgi:two-component system response regulator NreC
MSAHAQLSHPSFDFARSYATSLPTTVGFADDHRLARRGLRLALERERDLEVVAEADDLPAARRQVREHQPDVLVLDLRLSNGSSIALIGRLGEETPGTEIVVLTTEDSPAFARRALDAGAIGYVLTDTPDGQLALAIRRAARRLQYVSPRVAAGLDALPRAAVEGDLTGREREVLRLIALGHTNVEIAVRLHLSRRTVETHRTRIHNKLGLSRRWELVQYALAQHLIGPEPTPVASELVERNAQTQ